MKFTTRTMFIIFPYVACALMAWRTWYVESQRPPVPKFERLTYAANREAAGWGDLPAETPVYILNRELVGEPGSWQWEYRAETARGVQWTFKDGELLAGDYSRAWNVANRNFLDAAKKNAPKLAAEYAEQRGDGSVRVEQQLIIDGVVVDASANPRRLAVIRQEQPYCLVNGQRASQSWEYSWVDVDTGDDVAFPMESDTILGGPIDLAYEGPIADRFGFEGFRLEFHGEASVVVKNCIISDSNEVAKWYDEMKTRYNVDQYSVH